MEIHINEIDGTTRLIIDPNEGNTNGIESIPAVILRGTLHKGIDNLNDEQLHLLCRCYDIITK